MEASLKVSERDTRWTGRLFLVRIIVAATLLSFLFSGIEGTLAGAENEQPDRIIPTASPTSTPTTSEPGASPTPPPVGSSGGQAPRPPQADAGLDQVAEPGTLVVLDGSASRDADGEQLTYSWRKLDGPNVQIEGAASATPSFVMGEERGVYIFSLIVRDETGRIDEDSVVVAARESASAALPAEEIGPGVAEPDKAPTYVAAILNPLNIGLLLLSLVSSLVALLERIFRAIIRSRWRLALVSFRGGQKLRYRVRVVHFQTNEPLAGAQAEFLNEGGELVKRRWSDLGGIISAALKPGTYRLVVKVAGFAVAPPTQAVEIREDEQPYSGGLVTAGPGADVISLVVPMRPTIGQAAGSWATTLLRLWQQAQRIGHYLTWPVFVLGAVLNTWLMLWLVSSYYVVIEVIYVALVLIKIILEVRFRPSFGLVRDAITHVPLDLAVVRLYETGTNRLVFTRVTDSQGRFFAIPPAGQYNVVVSKAGYATFTKERVTVSPGRSRSLDIKANLMPIVGQALAPIPIGI